jgi:hypothetical protein
MSDPPKVIKIPCPRCMADIKFLAMDAGRRKKCPKCGKDIQVPGERRKRQPRLEELAAAAEGEGEEETGEDPREDDSSREPSEAERHRDEGRRLLSERTVPGSLKAFGFVLYVASFASLLYGIKLLLSGAVFGAPGLIVIAISGYMLKLAAGLREGERSAVVGLAIALAAFLCLDFVVWKVTGAKARDFGVVVGLRAVFMGLPIAIGLANWNRLR